MRAILNVSLPLEQKILIEKRARRAKKTISAYILHAVEVEQSITSEDELMAIITKAEKDHKAGKTKKLTSLADLMKK